MKTPVVGLRKVYGSFDTQKSENMYGIIQILWIVLVNSITPPNTLQQANRVSDSSDSDFQKKHYL